MAEFFLPTHYLRLLAEQLQALNVDTLSWLARCNLTPNQLKGDFRPAFSTFKTLVKEALELSGEPMLGLLFGQRLSIYAHGIIGFNALQGATLRQTLQFVERYMAVHTSLLSFTHEQDDAKQLAHIRLAIDYPLGEIERPVLEAVIMAIKNVFEAITPASAERVQCVRFPFSDPDYADIVRQMINYPIAWSQPWAGFSVDSALLDMPLQLADPVTFHEIEQICQRKLMQMNEKTALGVRIHQLLRELILEQHRLPSLEFTASLFNMTPRTLHRHLEGEGSSFKQIVQEVRHQMAIEAIHAGNLSMQEIAWMLGYQDAANFRRAFKQWEGVPPSQFASKNTRHKASRGAF